MEEILKKLDNLESYINYINEKNDDDLTAILAKLNIAEEKINRMLVRDNKSEIEKQYKNDYEDAQKANQANKKNGNIRVGRLLTAQDKGRKTPITFGFINICIISGPGKYIGKELDPNHLRYNGKIISNIWEFSKIYPQHLTNNILSIKNIKADYWDWQKNGFESEHVIRYPFGMQSYGDHIGYVDANKKEILNAYEIRKNIFAPIYKYLVKKTDDYKKLEEMLKDGYNLQICDLYALTGSLASLNIKQTKGAYGEDTVGSIEINKENIEKILSSQHEFSAAFYIAAFLLGYI